MKGDGQIGKKKENVRRKRGKRVTLPPGQGGKSHFKITLGGKKKKLNCYIGKTGFNCRKMVERGKEHKLGGKRNPPRGAGIEKIRTTFGWLLRGGGRKEQTFVLHKPRLRKNDKKHRGKKPEKIR